jgi:hypothetical protein
MIPFQPDPSWYERYWWSHRHDVQPSPFWTRLGITTARVREIFRPTRTAAAPTQMHESAVARFAPRMSRVKLSPASILRSQAQTLRPAGRDVVTPTSGDPDFPAPDHVPAPAHAASLRGDTRYTTVDGTAALKDAVRPRFRRDNGLDYEAAVSIWMLTLALFVWFLICSLVAALLATHFGWLAPAKALV